MMNLIQRLRRTSAYTRASSYWRIFKFFSTRVVAVAGINGLAVLACMSTREKLKRQRVYDAPTWQRFTKEQQEDIIRKRTMIVTALKDFYEMKDVISTNPNLSQLFTVDCILEDPFTRCIGFEEISRAFNLLPRVFKKINFTEFVAIHHEDMIQIENYRMNVPNHGGDIVERPSNLIIHLRKEEGEEDEKACYIVDEWGCVALMQPATHNKYLFAGTTAKFLRRFITHYYFVTLEENKSWWNVFWVLDAFRMAVEKMVASFEQKKDSFQPISPEMKHLKLMDTQEKVFNAGGVQTDETVK